MLFLLASFPHASNEGTINGYSYQLSRSRNNGYFEQQSRYFQKCYGRVSKISLMFVIIFL